MKYKGIFITFEGTDGSGKTTQIQYLKNYLEREGIPVTVTREPGGTRIGERIRRILLDKGNRNMSDRTEILLYAAARAQHIEEFLKPALAAGNVVICDRFVDSSIAYQGYGRDMLVEVMAVNSPMLAELTPDITFLLRLQPKDAFKRIEGRVNDRMETQGAQFHERVYKGYEELLARYPKRIIGLEANLPKKELKKQICQKVTELIEQRKL